MENVGQELMALLDVLTKPLDDDTGPAIANAFIKMAR